MEGEMETKSETGEKFIKYDKIGRPPLCKKFTQLHLEGDLDITTEKREKFIPFEIQKRPLLVKKATNLHLEGDLNFIPEYTREYIPYKNWERSKPAKPVHHLKPGGVFADLRCESKSVEKNLHPTIPFLRESDALSPFEEDLPRKISVRSRAQSFVKSNENYLAKSTRNRTQPNIIFTKASDSDISRTSIQVDSLLEKKQSQTCIRDTSQDDLKKIFVSSKGQSDHHLGHPSQRPATSKTISTLTSKREVSIATYISVQASRKLIGILRNILSVPGKML